MTTAILVARMGSSRFPGKTMQPVLGKPMIERMLERVSRAGCLDRIVLATTERPEDDPLCWWAQRLGLLCHRGPAEDVLGRVHQAWKRFGGDAVVELLGDNPLVHSALIDAVVGLRQSGRFDTAVNVTREYPRAPAGLPRFPVGIRVQATSADALDRVAARATNPMDREHSTRYFTEHPEEFSIGTLAAEGPWADLHRPEWTFAVNYPHNLDGVRQVFAACHPRDPDFDLHAVMRVAAAGRPPLEWMSQKEWVGGTGGGG
jgi:spore coat polysaccharide biosynthesis protein SpsF